MWIAIWIACQGDIVSGEKKTTEDTSSVNQPSDQPIEPSSDTSEEEPIDREPIDRIEQRIVYTTIRNGGGGGVHIYSPERKEVVWSIVNSRGKHWLDAQQSSDGQRIYVLEDNLFSPIEHSKLLVFDQNGLVSENFFRNFHHTMALYTDPEGEVIFTLEQEFMGLEPVVITDKVMRYRNGFSEPIFEIKNSVNYDILENNFKVLENGDIDKSHANTLRYEPSRNSLILSLAGLNCIVELSIDGIPLHFYLGKDFSPDAMNDTPATIWSGGQFLKPHGARFDDTGTLWVISDTEYNGEKSKEIQSYQLVTTQNENEENSTNEGETHHTLSIDNIIPPPYEGMLPAAGGDLMPWQNGNFMVSWGFSGVLEEVNTEGERIWMMETPIQESLGFFGATTIQFEN
jgi:hypothetical protein